MTIFEYIRQELGDDPNAEDLDDYTLAIIIDAIVKYKLLQEADHG